MPSRFAASRASRVRTNVKADDDCAIDARKHDVVLGNRAYAAVDGADTNLGIGELLKRLLDSLDRALNIRLDDDVEILDLALFELAVQLFQRGSRAVLDHRRTSLRRALFDDLTAPASRQQPP